MKLKRYYSKQKSSSCKRLLVVFFVGLATAVQAFGNVHSFGEKNMKKSFGHNLSTVDTSGIKSTLPKGNGELQIMISWIVDRNALADRLADVGATVETAYEYGLTPLIMALILDQKESFYNLLAQGADSEESDLYGRTPLMVAALLGEVDAVKHLLEAGAQQNKKNVYNRTALMMASDQGFDEIVRLLKDAGAK